MLRSVPALDDLLAMGADEAAAFWLVRQDAADSPRDDAIFEQWLEADPVHGTVWAKACSAWEELGNADAEQVAELRSGPVQARSSWGRWSVAVAASLVAILTTTVTLRLSREDRGQPAAPVIASVQQAGSMSTFATVLGQRKSVTLADGSVVTLNTDTVVTVAFDARRRDLRLDHGQAFFAVAHESRRPFVVSALGNSVTATGTKFEVRSTRDAMRVILVEGRVRVASNERGSNWVVELKAGQQLEAKRGTVSISKADIAGVADWQQGIVTFHDAKLSDAAAELNRYATSVHLLIRDPRIAAIRISGTFHTNDPARFARSVSEIYSLRLVTTATTLELVSKTRPRR